MSKEPRNLRESLFLTLGLVLFGLAIFSLKKEEHYDQASNLPQYEKYIALSR